jgi:ADP-ribose pyrophosphatase YjhB (NUDIX family)
MSLNQLPERNKVQEAYENEMKRREIFAREIKNVPAVRRAYVIVWWDTPEGILMLSGRENAVHEKALRELLARGPRVIELDENGADRTRQIGKNLGGTLLIGRTALPGGRVDRNESFREAAARELAEEFGITQRFLPGDLVQIGENATFVDGSEIMFFSLDLATIVSGDPTEFARNHCKNFVANSDKRSMEIVTPARLISLLDKPDDEDKAYILQEMQRIVSQIYPDSILAFDSPLALSNVAEIRAAFGSDATSATNLLEAMRLRLAKSMINFQVGRSLQHQVDAVIAFVKSRATLSLSAKLNSVIEFLSEQ